MTVAFSFGPVMDLQMVKSRGVRTGGVELTSQGLGATGRATSIGASISCFRFGLVVT